MPVEPTKPEIELVGQITRFVYQSDDQAYSVARFQPEGGGEEVTLAGALFGVRAGDMLVARGAYVDHPRFGRQLKIASVEVKLPTTAHGIKSYLERGGVKGIGKGLTRRLVEAFGDRTVQMLDESPDDVLRVLGQKRGATLLTAWHERRSERDLQIFLRGLGLGPALSQKIFRTYGDSTTAIVREDPFRLCREITGIGFKIADGIAGQLGFAKEAATRLEAGVMFRLEEAAQEGHAFLPQIALLKSAATMLGVAQGLVLETIERLVRDTVLVRRSVDGQDAIYHPHLDRIEQGVATALARLLPGPPPLPAFSHDRAIAWSERTNGIELSAEQRSAIHLALTRKVAIVTGGPGVGKTTFLRTLVAILNQVKVSPALTAPTGRAAKRLAQATGCEASTIHRLLRFDPKTRRFIHGARDPLPHRYVIIDEVSMVDLELMHAVLTALQPACSLLLVGDSDQLPSVGPGSVLRDLIASEVVPVMRLTTIFRQAANNPIVDAAHRILRGHLPLFGGEGMDGIYFLEAESSERARDVIVGLCTRRLPTRLGYDALSDIQALSPMNRGPVGVDALNAELQLALNPSGTKTVPTRDMRVGDRVLQTRNNYDLNVFNGDLGRVRGFVRNPDRLQVVYEGREVTYAGDDIGDLRLAYAMSVHRSQGCEFPVVVMPLVMEHRMLLRRNVLYTAITRAKRLVALVGSHRALATAIRDDSLMLRYSNLGGRLRAAAGRGR